MSFWFKKHFWKEEWASLFDLFEKHFISSGGPKEMMMIKSGEVLDTTIYMRMKYNNGKIFKGFEEVALSDIPQDFTFLIGHQDERDELKALLDKG